MKAAAWKALCLLAPAIASAFVLPEDWELTNPHDQGGEDDIAIIQLSRQKLMVMNDSLSYMW
jgi:hypothetical protein